MHITCYPYHGLRVVLSVKLSVESPGNTTIHGRRLYPVYHSTKVSLIHITCCFLSVNQSSNTTIHGKRLYPVYHSIKVSLFNHVHETHSSNTLIQFIRSCTVQIHTLRFYSVKFIRSTRNYSWIWKGRLSDGRCIWHRAQTRTNLPVKGWVSIDRSMVAALLSTTPRQVLKSSTDDSVLKPSIRVFTGCNSNQWYLLPNHWPNALSPSNGHCQVIYRYIIYR